MEIHHHPKIERRNFKEYLLEGLMIFLAVTLGFFAESLREHITAENGIHDYMQEMTENLRYDTIRCGINYQDNLAAEKGMDSLRAEIKLAINGKINSNALYYYELQYAGTINQAAFNTITINELKNSGSLRLIGNRAILNEIYDYYERKVFATQAFLPTPAQLDALTKTLNEFFSYSSLDDYTRSFDSISITTYGNNYDYSKMLHRDPPLPLLKSDPDDLERLYTEVTQFEIQVKKYNFWMLYTKQAATKLIGDIANEYHLDTRASK